MKIAILKGEKNNDPHARMIKTKAEERGHISSIVYIKEQRIALSQENGLEVYCKKRLNSFDVVIIRGVGKFHSTVRLIVSYLREKNKIVIDEKIADSRFLIDKMFSSYLLCRNNIPVVKTFQVFEEDNLEEVFSELGFPLIIKDKLGKQGKEVFKAKNGEEARKIFNKVKDSGEFILQKYINTNYDVRILIIGNKVIGAMKRVAPKGDFRSNISIGGSGENYKLTKNIADLALAVQRIISFDILGVDIIFDGNEPYVLEVNRAPQFKGFMKATGIDVSEEIIKYIEEKGRRNNAGTRKS